MAETKEQAKKILSGIGKGGQSARERLRELMQGLRSNDAPTRRMSAFFFLSCFAAALVLVAGGYRLREHHLRRAAALTESEKAAKHLSDFLARQAEEAKHKASQIPIGTFSIELQPMEGQGKVPGVHNLAELELVLDCDNKETREYIEDHLPQVRNQVTNFFTALERSELMSREGKKKIKKGIIDQLNTWLPHGKIEDVYITRFFMT